MSVAALMLPLATSALADTGTFPDPVDSDAPVTDVIQHTISYDGSVLSSTVTFAAWDLAIAQSARLVVALDVDGDGAGDFEMQKDSGGESAEVTKSNSFETLCAASSTFSESARSITLSAPALCLGNPSFIRSNVYFSAQEGFDFAPTPYRFTAPVAGSSGAIVPPPSTRPVSCPAAGRDFSHVAEDPAVSDIVTYRLAYDGTTACVVFGMRAWDRASAQSGRFEAELDTNGDGASDFSLQKPHEGESAKVQQEGTFQQRCTAEASFNDAAKTLTLAAPASCLGNPASLRTSLYVSLDEGADFAPAPNRFTAAVGPGLTSSPTPSPSASPAPQDDVAPTLALSPAAISAGQATIVTYRGTPGSTVDILSRTQPATVFSKIGVVTLDSNGVGTSSHKPQKNTRITAQTGRGVMSSTAPIIAVRSVASFNSTRVGVNTYTFTGRVYPALNNRLVNLYRNGTLVAQGRCNAEGIYSITKSLAGGSYDFQVKTPNDQDNLGTTSRQLRLLIS